MKFLKIHKYTDPFYLVLLQKIMRYYVIIYVIDAIMLYN